MRWMLAAAVMVACPVATAAQAQTAIEGRVDRLESEMRAVQRKVFPGGAGAQPVQPQYSDSQPPAPTPGLPSSSPITDITARLDADESQLRALTGQIEQLQFEQRQEKETNAAFRRTIEARVKALEDANAARAGSSETAAVGGPASVPTPVPARPTPATPAPKPATAGPAPTTKPVATPPASTRPDPARAAQLAAVERPLTDDPGDDSYVYGYRLWQAKLYPEAIVALKEVTTKFPSHRRWSYAQNLLGRAYLDSGAPASAAKVFYDNYRTKPAGERAPDSLYYLAQALTELKKAPADICRVYSELTDVFGAKLSAEMKAGVAEGRAAQKCP